MALPRQDCVLFQYYDISARRDVEEIKPRYDRYDGGSGGSGDDGDGRRA